LAFARSQLKPILVMTSCSEIRESELSTGQPGQKGIHASIEGKVSPLTAGAATDYSVFSANA
jgi:hypothetical protein